MPRSGLVDLLTLSNWQFMESDYTEIGWRNVKSWVLTAGAAFSSSLRFLPTYPSPVYARNAGHYMDIVFWIFSRWNVFAGRTVDPKPRILRSSWLFTSHKWQLNPSYVTVIMTLNSFLQWRMQVVQPGFWPFILLFLLSLKKSGLTSWWKST